MTLYCSRDFHWCLIARFYSEMAKTEVLKVSVLLKCSQPFPLQSFFLHLLPSYPVPSTCQTEKHQIRVHRNLNNLQISIRHSNKFSFSSEVFITYKYTICTSGKLSSFHLLLGNSKIYLLWEVRSKAEIQFSLLPTCPHESSP